MKKWFEWIFSDHVLITENESQASDRGDHAVRTSDVANHARLPIPRLVAVFMMLGLFARVLRYYLCFPLWDDESFLCVNLISRSYFDLLQPLDYHQVAPILFLWIERTSVKLLGFSEYALRLFPFVCSITSLFVFRRLAERLISGPALLFSVAVFAVSYPGIRYAAEAKPYGTDMFMSLLMLALVVSWQCSRDVRLLGVLAAMMPVVLGISYPAVFAAGGMSLVVGGILIWQKGTKFEWIAWMAWNVTLVTSFVAWFVVVGHTQSGAEAEFMGDYWKMSFPPVGQLWMVPFWLIKTHASDFLAYPAGGPNWASTISLLLCSAGLWQLVRTRQFVWLGLLLGPAGLHFLAAAMQKYPYGGHVKFSHSHAPMICCLIGLGLSQFVGLCSRWGISLKCGCTWSCLLLLAIGLGGVVRDLANPYKTRSDFRARAFAQSFWPGAHSAEEVLCLKSDQGLDFVPEQHSALSWSAHYRCNRAIEVSRSSLHPANLSRVSVDRPLRCVLYRDGRYELDRERLEQWLAEMNIGYELIAHESLPFPRMAKNDRNLVTMEYIDSYKFVPRNALAKESTALADGLATQKHE